LLAILLAVAFGILAGNYTSVLEPSLPADGTYRGLKLRASFVHAASFTTFCWQFCWDGSS
jgi:hypothetical protein